MIEIKISGATPLEALASLTAFGYHCMSNPEVSAAATRIYETEQQAEEKAKKTKAEAPAPPPSAAPETPTPAEAGTWSPGGCDQPEEVTAEAAPKTPPAGQSGTKAPSDPKPAKAPSLEEVRDAGIKCGKEYGREVVAAILQQFGATSISTLKADDRAAFLAALEKVGEDNA